MSNTVTIYTTAVTGYDWTIESSTVVEPRRVSNSRINGYDNPLRAVVVRADLAEAQEARYASGVYVATTDRDIAWACTKPVDVVTHIAITRECADCDGIGSCEEQTGVADFVTRACPGECDNGRTLEEPQILEGDTFIYNDETWHISEDFGCVFAVHERITVDGKELPAWIEYAPLAAGIGYEVDMDDAGEITAPDETGFLAEVNARTGQHFQLAQFDGR